MEIREILINSIKIIENIRLPKDKQEEVNLMRSIKDNGLLQPIGVKEEKVGYTLIWGSRRLYACKKLGWKYMPCIIFMSKDEEMSEEEFFIINSTENLQRRNNSLLELGRIVRILNKTMSASEISVKLGISKSMVLNALTEIDRIPKKFHNRIRIMSDNKEKAGDIPLSTASKVTRLRGLSQGQKGELLEAVSKEDLSYQQTHMLANLIKTGMTKVQGLKEMNNYKHLNVKLFIKKKKFEERVKELDCSDVEFVIKALNSYMKDDNFASNMLVKSKE